MSLPREESLNWVFRDLVLDDEYGLKHIRPYPQTLIDIGANAGIFSLIAGITFPRAIIHSYEPNLSLVGYLEHNLRQVGAKIFTEGIAEHDGRGDFSQTGDSMVGQCVASEAGETPVVSLHTAVRRIGGSVDLLKMDCEGAEWDILNDPSAFTNIKEVRMEYHLIKPDHSVERLLGTFESMGYRCVHIHRNQDFGLAWFTRG